jgi:hypothetical protein
MRFSYSATERLDLAASVYRAVLGGSETFSGALGRDLAYLLGAIVTVGGSCEWRSPNRAIVRVLAREFGHEHPVWLFIAYTGRG